MSRKPAKRPRLGDRDYEIFEHVMRYRLTTREVLHRLFFPDCEINAVTKVTSRLTTHAYLNRFELDSLRSYFVLGPVAAKILGISLKKTRQPGALALARDYAVLAYCCESPELRERLTVREVHERYPDLLRGKLDSSHYYLDHDGTTARLAYMSVDLGGTPDGLLSKSREALNARLAIPAFKQVIDHDRFLIAIVTCSNEKRGAIEDALKRHTWPVRFRVGVVPDLVSLIGGIDSPDDTDEGGEDAEA
jgi:hypothetical protein